MNTKATMSRKDLERQVHDLSEELELSTLINKGAISENRELKTQITELRAENTVLRTAEDRLAQTESDLEQLQKVCKEQESRINRLERASGDLQRKLKDSRDSNQRVNGWITDLERFVDQGKILRAGVTMQIESGDAGPSVSTAACQLTCPYS